MDGNRCPFKTEWEDEDILSDKPDQRKTADEIAKAMSSLVSFLNFEAEEASIFQSQQLPTLDTSVWWDGSQPHYVFYEKPRSPTKSFKQTQLCL